MIKCGKLVEVLFLKTGINGWAIIVIGVILWWWWWLSGGVGGGLVVGGGSHIGYKWALALLIDFREVMLTSPPNWPCLNVA